jgi:hypothetical protein
MRLSAGRSRSSVSRLLPHPRGTSDRHLDVCYDMEHSQVKWVGRGLRGVRLTRAAHRRGRVSGVITWSKCLRVSSLRRASC